MRLDGQRRPLAGAAWTAAARECSHLPVHVHVRVHVRVRVRVHVHVHVRVRVHVHVHVCRRAEMDQLIECLEAELSDRLAFFLSVRHEVP